MKSTELKSIPLTQDDINLITYALRKFSNEVGFSNLKDDTENLIEYIERENKQSKGGGYTFPNKKAANWFIRKQ